MHIVTARKTLYFGHAGLSSSRGTAKGNAQCLICLKLFEGDALPLSHEEPVWLLEEMSCKGSKGLIYFDGAAVPGLALG